MKCTVVICTHNRVNLLMRTIRFLNIAKRPERAAIKILVVANACTDDTTIALKNYIIRQVDNSEKLALDFEEEPIPGKSHALNRAINLVSEGFLVFVDDDHRVDSHFFGAIKSAINQYSSTGIFCGKIIPDWTGAEPSWIHEKGKYKIYPLPIPQYDLGNQQIQLGLGKKLPGGGNLIVRRNIFDKVGNFSVSLGPKGHNLSGSEDSDFILRAIKEVKNIQYIPSIIQYHFVDVDRLKLFYLIKKSFQRTRTLARIKDSGQKTVPHYLWRKLLEYIVMAFFSFNPQRRRFYLMRIASTSGEITGIRER